MENGKLKIQFCILHFAFCIFFVQILRSAQDDTYGVGRNPNHHAKGVYIIRPSDGISSMHSIVYHPCNAWHIIKALPCISRLPSF